MSIRYEYDQYDIVVKYVDNVPVVTFGMNENDPNYVEWLANRDTVKTVFVEKVQQLPTLDQIKDRATETLKDILNDFMGQFTKRFSDAEIANFGEQVLQARDYLANGPNAYNSPITIEASITGQSAEQTVQLILGHHAFQTRLMPWVRSFRQNTTKLIYAAQTFTELESIVLNIKPALYGALERNEI